MPIIGHGDVASVLIDREDITFFASGVSDSKCTNPFQFKREENLLKEMPRHIHLVYFSTLAIYYNWNPYVAHKKRMEQMVRDLFQSYTIVRIGNISWGGNPNTLINYLRAHPEAEIQKTYRHIVDKEEFQYWLGMIPLKQRNEMNVPGRMVWVPTLAEALKYDDADTDWVYKILLPSNEVREKLGYEGNDKP